MITARTPLDAWKAALTTIRAEGRRFVDNENRECAEVLNLVVMVENLQEVQAPLQWIRANGQWLYPSDEELREALFTKEAEERSRYAYGNRIFSFRGQLDQLEDFVIPLLRKSPETRRALVVLADPLVDETTVSSNFISLVSLWFRIVDGKLALTATIRSNDFLLGWPANAYQVSLIQTHVAQRVGVQPGPITTVSFSAHYFTADETLIEKLLRR